MINRFKKLREDDGFTLLEMSIVLLIVAALLLLIIPNVEKVNETTNNTTEEAAANTVETQIMLYKLDEPNRSEEDILQELIEDNIINDRQYDAYIEYKQ